MIDHSIRIIYRSLFWGRAQKQIPEEPYEPSRRSSAILPHSTPAANKLKVPMKIVQPDAHVAKADLAQAGAPKLILPSDAHVAKADLAQAGAPKLILPKLVLFADLAQASAPKLILPKLVLF